MQSPLAIALARALCDDATDTADLLVADLVEAGLSVEEICLDHLAPAAKCLGEWWETDRLPFTEVAMATSRIQAILRRMPLGARGRHRRSFQRGAVFCAVPGEQHTLGVMMAADLFRRNGWDVGLMVGLDHGDILSRLERDDRCVIGLSCSGAHSLAALDRLMTALRAVRPDARLILSGQIVLDGAALAQLPAADAVVRSVAEAEAQIARLDRDYALGRLPRASVA
ncbi:cobalamin B12-binding domain-containing protein [Roseicyclus sp.]|uniref:cobalamin B12-binding domain-containing protein n=1 Tax=Roseicyclus sp. TaxID=1914329 RepID=UPI003FA02553